MGGQVYGRVYELFTSDPARDGEHPYAGQTTETIHQRVYGRSSSAHTSPESIARDPWKARILPAPAGYRCLKTIYATGDPAADQVRLDMAEAFAIDELNTTYNKQRPIRSARTGRPVPYRAPTRRELAAAAQARASRRRRLGLLVLVALFTYLAARVAIAMQMPWPAFPWIAAPTAGVALGWAAFWKLHASARRLSRGSRR